MLQQISRYADLARTQRPEGNYLEMMGDRVDRATRTTQALFDRVTSAILESKVARPATDGKSFPPFSVLPAPSSSASLPVRAPSTPPAPVASRPPARPVHTPPTPALPIRNATGARELLLLIDDDADMAEVATQVLTAEGYKVIVARDGVEALEIYRHAGGDIRLVILDFFLPVLDGDAVFDELQTLNPNIAVVLSSGFAEQTKLSAMLARGLRGFIPKPYTRAKLLEQVRSILDASRAA